MDSVAGAAHSANPMLDIANVVAGSIEHQTRVAQAHDLGPSGTEPDVTSLELNRANLPVLAESVPRDYLEANGSVASQTALLMRDHEPDEDVREEWDMVTRFYENLATAISEFLQGPYSRRPVDLSLSAPVPAVLRYDTLAARVHPDATARMLAAAIAVRAYALRQAYGVTEVELGWLRGLAQGNRGIDVGQQFGYSERDFYRAQQELWKKLGVDGRNQAFVLATELGWLDDAP